MGVKVGDIGQIVDHASQSPPRVDFEIGKFRKAPIPLVAMTSEWPASGPVAFPSPLFGQGPDIPLMVSLGIFAAEGCQQAECCDSEFPKECASLKRDVHSAFPHPSSIQ